MHANDTTVLIPAAGYGERLGLGPKALLELAGEPLLSWVSRKALQFSNDVIVAVPRGTKISYDRFCPGCKIIEGGATRQESVALLAQESARKWLLITDVARPFATLGLYSAVLDAARDKGVAGAFLCSDVPVARIEDNRVTQTLLSHEAGIFQLPQAFSRELLLALIEEGRAKSWQVQSTLELALRSGVDVGVVPGEKSNIKLTSLDDWRCAHHLTEFLR